MNDSRLIWLNGKLIPAQEAAINVLSPTAQFGLNVFEGIRCYWNSKHVAHFAFKLDAHFNRLERSLKMFRIDPPIARRHWKDIIYKVIQANNYTEDIAIRQTIFVDGHTGTWSSKSPTGMFIAPITHKRKENPLKNGICCCISSWRRISEDCLSPKIKCGANYINSRMAQIEALENGYDSALPLNKEGTVAEGPGSTFFMVRDGRLITPPLYASVLESITRNVLIELAWNHLGVVTEERPIDRTELYICEEAFLCGSAAEITPITSVDGFTVGSGHIGSLTSMLHQIYLQAAEGSYLTSDAWGTFI